MGPVKGTAIRWGEIVRVVNHGVSKVRLSKLSDIKNKNEKLVTITCINWHGTKELRDNRQSFTFLYGSNGESKEILFREKETIGVKIKMKTYNIITKILKLRIILCSNDMLYANEMTECSIS